MKLEELRIGNWVNKGFIGESNLKEYQIKPHDFKEYDLWVYRAIPITEEWLLRFGFDIDWIISHKTNYFNLRQVGDKYYYTADMHNNTSMPLVFVHQLQNLYHSLTGEEL